MEKVGLNWVDEATRQLRRLSLSETTAFQEALNLKIEILSRKLSTEKASSFGDSLDRWCTEFAYSLAGRCGPSPATCPNWLGIGFFSQYLLCKMKLFPAVSQITGLDESVLQFPKRTLAGLVRNETADTGWIDRKWIHKLENLSLPDDTRTLEQFISSTEEALGLAERHPQKPNRIRLVFRKLVTAVPYVGPAIDAAMFGEE